MKYIQSKKSKENLLIEIQPSSVFVGVNALKQTNEIFDGRQISQILAGLNSLS